MNDAPDSKADESFHTEVTLAAPFGVLAGNEKADPTLSYTSEKEGDKLMFPKFAGWIPKKVGVYALSDLTNEADLTNEPDNSKGHNCRHCN
ncbi:hypothetical protein TVAG_138050 [Trichomonas vaginalis G3]|uniref:Uncharacterized protein n=1 Tax=Trichomonas vaginalis (strain ATCC PRA-98 / G3) TaxID=412133 RepID=A2EC36_TRIV3|nr:hypothetical protein TVAGG3_0269630 [Trichomonas vaginalis G3]EAY09811.1 hypothetical protein TVAG_138050 [Trichomonas vaginalis G3]KAI5525761.1 hypothetical protein TVAGG3_0269630 [Trichomonas vaginalis G3]|eukprot:XP_001322034.1 hypothetical protein [Trichomonas vaginalis G3]